MRWKYLITASRPAVTATLALLAGVVVLAGTAGPEALAAPAGAHHLGTFKSWSAAQKAAGFKLLKPTRTYGHKQNGPIGVSRCERKDKAAKRVVTVNYGLTPSSALSLSQNNSGGACSSTGRVKRLHSYTVNGTRAVLTGKCGMRGLRSCTSKRIFLILTWTKHGRYYVATSFGLGRKTLLGFARGLRPVG